MLFLPFISSVYWREVLHYIMASQKVEGKETTISFASFLVIYRLLGMSQLKFPKRPSVHILFCKMLCLLEQTRRKSTPQYFLKGLPHWIICFHLLLSSGSSTTPADHILTLTTSINPFFVCCLAAPSSASFLWYTQHPFPACPNNLNLDPVTLSLIYVSFLKMRQLQG